VWNKLTGKGNPPASEDLKEFFSSSIRSAGHVGAQVAVSGAVVVVAKSGWLGAVAKNTPAKHLVTAVHAGLENAKILSKMAKGELTPLEALDKMGQLNTSLVGSLVGAAAGATQGALMGAALGPVGAFVGGIVGGIVGGMAGTLVGEAVYNSWKKTVSTGVSVVKNVSSAIASVGRSIVSGFRSLFS
jgi:phage tail tape-measure protein